MRLRVPVLALLLTAAAAGCGGSAGTTPTAGADAAPAATNAKADATCLKFLRFPASTVVWTNRKEQLRFLGWAERHVRVAVPAHSLGTEYRQAMQEPAERVIRQLEQAQRVRRRGARADAVRDDAFRAYEDFYQRYRDAAVDLKLERCAAEQVKMDELEAKFTRSAEAICEDTGRRFKDLPPDAPLRAHEAQVRQLERMADKLDALTPPASKRPLWNRAMRDLKRSLGDLRDMAEVVREYRRGRAGQVPAARVLAAAQRRSVRAIERADRAFQGLYLEGCSED